jgi:UrcA family protein
MKTLTAMILVAALGAGAQLAHADVAEDLRQFAHAEPADDPRLHTAVKFADLDLTQPEGAAALYGRMHAAAEHVCASLQRSERTSIRRYNACITEAISAAVTKLNRPVLTTYYRTTLGRNAPTQVAEQH